MPLQRNLPDSPFYIRACEQTRILLLDRELRRSFLLSPRELVENWPITAPAELSAAHLEACLSLKPELVLLGTGPRQQFPAPALQAVLLTRGIGFEVMDNASAARTFNLLAQDGRAVVAAFILPG